MVGQRIYTTEELAEIFGIEPADVHNYLLHHNICFFKDRDRYEMSEWDLKEWDRKGKRKRITRDGTERQEK